MIVTCPACDTRYTVPDGNLGGTTGRRVRCAHCGNLWHYSPEAAAIHAAIAETAAARDTATVAPPRPLIPPPPAVETERPSPPRLNTEAAASMTAAPRVDPDMAPPPPAGLTRPAVATEVPGAVRRRRRYIAEIVLILLLIVVVVVLALARDRIAQFAPALRPLIARLQLSEPATAGLSVTVTPSRSGDSLVIDGDITNSASSARQVPRIRVALRDANKDEVDSKEISPPVGELAPGAKAHFTTGFDHPSAAATGVAVTFATE